MRQINQDTAWHAAESIPLPVQKLDYRLRGWTVERTDLLKSLCLAGIHSCSQMAAKIGGVTRNAVIGKIHRMGLIAGHQDTGRPTKSATARPHKPKFTPFKTTRRGHAAGQSLPPTMPEELVMDIIPEGQRKTLMQLDGNTCHWPVGDPHSVDFYFCGGDAVLGYPYCGYHCRAAYQPTNYVPRRTPSPSIVGGEG